MKKLLIALLAVFCIYAAAAPCYADGYEGSGTPDDPYMISTAEQLKQFAAEVSEVSGGEPYSGVYFKLANDIDLNSEPWTPIGWTENGSNNFGGTFDGGGFAVKGIYINSAADFQGLFRSLGAAGTIKNLTVDGSVTGGNYIGGIVGQNNSGTIENCASSVTATGKRYVGGIAGQNNAGRITDCSNSGSVSSTITTHAASSSYIGGIVGQNSAGAASTGALSRCHNTGVISGSNYVGGITGYTTAQTTICYNTGSVSGSGYIGGITGFVKGAPIPGSFLPDDITDTLLTDCYNTGAVSGTVRYTGGVVGQIAAGGTVESCYNTADVNGALIVGGVAGHVNGSRAALRCCYNIGKVDGSMNIGAVVGQNSSGTVEYCYYLDGSAGKGIGSGGGSAEMRTVPEFTSLISTLSSSSHGGWVGCGTMDFIRPALASNREVVDFTATEENPYIIDGMDSFNKLRNYMLNVGSAKGKYFKLTCNLLTRNNNIYIPGNFDGVFDGGGHSVYIYEYVVNQPLFNNVEDGGVVKNLNIYKSPYPYPSSGTNEAFIAARVKSGGMIENCHVSGTMTYSISSGSPRNYNYGGVAAIVDAGGTIKNCVNEFGFTLTSNNCVAYIGGIAGENNGTIENCIGMAGYYGLSFIRGSSTTVNAAYVGGIAGKNTGTIRNCLNITAIPNQENVTAGSIACNDGGIIENCYYDADRTPNLGSGDMGLGKTAEQIRSGEVAYLLQGSQPAQVWSQTIGMDDHPVPSGDVNGRVDRISTSQGYIYINGTGAEESPYLIPNLPLLETMRDYVNSGNSEDKYFKLTADIDMSQKYGEGGASWSPIGIESNKFEGVFDGNAHEISGLYINAPNEKYQGLFGFVGTGGTVKNLTVSGTVTGKQYIGGIAGRIDDGAAVYGCVNKSGVFGDSQFGGVAGINYGVVTNCANAGNIGDNKNIGTDSICGGILGENRGGITRCVNAGTVGVMYADEIKGGIIGYNASENTAADCYYLWGGTGSIKGVGRGDDNTKRVNSASRLKSGETAWLLQDGQDGLVWGQKLGTDAYPVPTSDSGKQVFKVTFATQSNPNFAERYANPNGTVTLPDAPAAEGQVFSDWSPNPGSGNVFDEKTPVTDDITVYASERTPFGGESGAIPLDTSGLVVIADCGNDETFEAAGYTLSGYDTSEPGDQTVTVTYGSKTAQFNITVTPKSLTGIELTHTPDKLIYYQGDELDITGMVITAVYDNNTTQFIDSNDLEVSELTDSVGEQTVTVTYSGQTAGFTVTVLERPAETGTVETPLIEVAEFYGGKRAIISCATEDAEIYYTIDGTEPTTSSDKYTSPFELTSNADIKAIAVKADMDDSDVEEHLVNIEKVAAPRANVKGEVEVGTAVKLLCSTSGAEIYYTIGDSLDENNYKKYTDGIIITGSMTIRAIAVKRGCVIMSDGVTFTYTVAPPEEPGGEVNRALLELEEAACKAGDTFSLPVYIYSESEVSDFRFTLEYDSDQFDYLGFKPGGDMSASSVSVTTDENRVTVRGTQGGITGCEACKLEFKTKPDIDSGEYILPVSDIEINAAEKNLTDVYYTDGYVRIISEDAKISADAFLFNSDDDVIEDVSEVSGTLSAMILADIAGLPEDERVTSFDAILAFYDTNGALVTLSTTEAEMSDDIDCFMVENIAIPENAEIGGVKLMIWDGIDTAKPLALAAPVL